MSYEDKLWEKFLQALKENEVSMIKEKDIYRFYYKNEMFLDGFKKTNLKDLMGEISREWKLTSDIDTIKSNLRWSFSDFDELSKEKQDQIVKQIQKNIINVKNSAKDIFAEMVQRENFLLCFYGAPGVGKSYNALKMQEYINKELGFDVTRVVEFATELIQKEQFELLKNQPYVSTMQGRNLLEALSNLSNIAVTDSPIDLGLLYNADEKQAYKVKNIIEKTQARYTEIPIFIKHNKNSLEEYSEVGRVHTKEESLEIEKKLLDTFSDKDFIIVERGLDPSLILAKVDEWCQNKFGVGFIEMLVDRNEIKDYIGVFPEPFENLQSVYEFLGGEKIDNQSIWEKTIDYLQNNVDFNDKCEDDLKEALSSSYRYDYATEVAEKIKEKLGEIFGNNFYLEVKADHQDIQDGMFYFNLIPVYSVSDFKDALIKTFNYMTQEIQEDIAEAKEFDLNNGGDINEKLKFQKDIAELLATKFGVFKDTPKYVPEPVSKFEEKLAEEVKNSVLI